MYKYLIFVEMQHYENFITCHHCHNPISTFLVLYEIILQKLNDFVG